MSDPRANMQAVIDLNEAREAALAATPHDWRRFRTFFGETFIEYGAWNITSVDVFIERVEQAWDKLRMKVKLEEILASDNRVVSRWSLTGVHQNEAFGYAPTGKPLAWESVEIYYFDERGKITSMRYFTDLIVLLSQLGFEVPPGHGRF